MQDSVSLCMVVFSARGMMGVYSMSNRTAGCSIITEVCLWKCVIPEDYECFDGTQLGQVNPAYAL